jgi:N-carbamoyl-L-amino-acid hydrolase
MTARAASSAGRAAGRAPEPDIALAVRLFDELRARTGHGDGSGITRESYGTGEQIAHDIVRREAEALGLTVERDAACNLYMTLSGKAPGPRIIIGSHLDSVPRGGNYDGAAGVLAGLAVVSGLLRAGVVPPQAITVMAIRAEESAWFGASYIGSRAAFGQVSGELLDGVTRAGDGLPLGKAIAAAGGAPDDLRRGKAHLRASDILCFVEPHIEQGPVLIGSGHPIGIVTDIRGSFRHRHALCRGAYAHSGATPRRDRQDAVAALAALVTRFDEFWEQREAAGDDLTITFGQVETDPAEASFSKVAGLARFSLDVRSGAPETLDRAEAELRRLISDIEARRGVAFDLGPRTGSSPAMMHRPLALAMRRIARQLSIPALPMPCGAGHDAATFAGMGVPSGMLFFRNSNGSHNPDEHLEIADFAAGTEVVQRLCLSSGDDLV